jgi:hypothetical protein
MSNTQQMTNVVGYYNGNKWPIQLVISKLNLTLTLEPGKYVLDRQGRKINDPYFEVFANNKQLHRETSTTSVPVIAIPVVAATTTTPSPSTNPVRSIDKFERDTKGVRRPVLTQAQPVEMPKPSIPVVASNSQAIHALSMDEARRLGFVRKVREVPEDYGVTDTNGLPPSRIPEMKYSIDPTINKAQPPLPKEMLNLPKDDPSNPQRSQLVAGLTQSNRMPAPDASTSPFANTTVADAPAESPLVAGTPITEAQESLPEESQPVLDEGAVESDPVVEAAETILPMPNLDDDDDDDEEPAPAPQPAAAAPKPAPAAPKAPTSAGKYICVGCGKPFGMLNQLKRHAEKEHPDRLNAILSPYRQQTLP